MARTGINARAGLDAGIVVPDLGVRVSAEIGTHIGKLERQMAHYQRSLEEVRAVPVEFNGSNAEGKTVIIAGTTYLVIQTPGTVPAGYVWEVRRVVIGNKQTPMDTGQAGVAFFFSSESDADYSYAAFRDSTATPFPVPAFYSAGQFVAYGNARIYALVSGYTANTNYTFSGTAIQRRAGGVRAFAEVS